MRRSKSTPRPIELESFGTYFYDHQKKAFFHKDGHCLTGKEVLDKFYKLHCDTIHRIKGLRLRWKLGSKSRAMALCGIFVQVCKWIIQVGFGRKFEPRDPMSGALKEYEKEDMKLLKTDSITVFGYKASKNLIFTFSIVIIMAYTLAYILKTKSPYLSGIVSNPLLVVCFCILLLSILDHLVPQLFLKLINLVIRVRFQLAFMKIKF